MLLEREEKVRVDHQLLIALDLLGDGRVERRGAVLGL
jgi:hypothetical protein